MQAHGPQEQIGQLGHLALRIATEPFHKRAWMELGFFLTSSALALVAVLILLAIGSTGLALSIVFVGILILAGGLRAARGFGRWQRALADRVLGEGIEEPEPFTPRPGFWGWWRATFGDAASWRAVGYFVAKVPLTIFGSWFALSVWLAALFDIVHALADRSGSTSLPAVDRVFGGGISNSPTPGLASRLGLLVVGVVLLLIAPWAMRVIVYLDRRLMHALLGPGASASRVRSLERSRSRTLESAAETLRRIERDLHDGTQAQLVALAMRLGQAKEKLEHLPAGADTADVASVRRLVDEAHRGVKEAIADLRDLARGIHPPALDTGLASALATLAARSPIPTEVNVSIPDRPSPAIETIAYFCAAELLANVAQHADASRATLSCARHGPWLRIVVRDNGRGGAALRRGTTASSGLAGLSDRVGAVDGHLAIASPPGGPTAVTIDLPLVDEHDQR